MNPINFLARNKTARKQLEALRPRLYRLAFSWTQNETLADDLAQEALIKALNNLQQLRDAKKIASWTFGIMHNCYRDYFRKQKNMENIDEHHMIDEHHPETDYENYSITRAVRSAVSNLPENQRQVVTLVDLEGFSYNEVSQILDIPTGTVMSRLCRARKALANQLLHYSDHRTAVNLRRVK